MPAKVKDWWLEERSERTRGFLTVAGMDEAGRGPLAGPVVAACVILPFEIELTGIGDSKKLSPAQRNRAFDLIYESAEGIGVGVADQRTIDELNILRATHYAMRLALESLGARPDIVLIDGLPVPLFPVKHRAIVKGDDKSASIAAASIVAKVTRDRIMMELDDEYPGYGFAAHKGYPTPDHLEALLKLGPCPIHRRSFGPVAHLSDSKAATGMCGAQPSLFSMEMAPSARRRELGVTGEAVAAAHLGSLGWEMLASRFYCREGEIDIVAKDGDTIVFVEVKARTGMFNTPSEAVNARKRKRMLTAAYAWLDANGGNEQLCRFDVLEVQMDANGLSTVNLLRNAFQAGE